VPTIARMGNTHIRLIAVIGVAKSDTSTFTQWLVNGLLATSQRKLLLLDLNVDNPTLSIPGHLSLSVLSRPLLKPHWARCTQHDHLHVVMNSHPVGVGSSRNSNILEFADSLHEQLCNIWNKHEYQSCLVHFPSFSPSAGSSNYLIMKLLQKLGIKDLVLSGGAANENIIAQFSEIKCNIMALSRHAETRLQSRVLTSVQKRNMSVQAYFHGIHQRSPRWNLTPISSWRPYTVSYRLNEYEENRGGTDFKACVLPHEIPPMYPNMLSNLLNGAVVSVVVKSSSDNPSVPFLLGNGDKIPYIEGLDISSLGDKWRGLALVRSIDVENQLLHLICRDWGPISPPHTILFVANSIEYPTWAYEEDFHYRQWAKRVGGNAAQELFADTKTTNGYPWVEVVRNT